MFLSEATLRALFAESFQAREEARNRLVLDGYQSVVKSQIDKMTGRLDLLCELLAMAAESELLSAQVAAN